jgi:hypothetical protein
VNVYLPEIPYVVYEVDEPHLTVDMQYKTLVNKGREAMAYLQFIADFYDNLPKHTVFIHSHRYSPDLFPVDFREAVVAFTSNGYNYVTIEGPLCLYELPGS